jgi:hypothetical protein
MASPRSTALQRLLEQRDRAPAGRVRAVAGGGRRRAALPARHPHHQDQRCLHSARRRFPSPAGSAVMLLTPPGGCRGLRPARRGGGVERQRGSRVPRGAVQGDAGEGGVGENGCGAEGDCGGGDGGTADEGSPDRDERSVGRGEGGTVPAPGRGPQSPVGLRECRRKGRKGVRRYQGDVPPSGTPRFLR